jgi:hypothetical protein
MADDELKWIEAALGAVSKLNADDAQDDLRDARCPKCHASDFVSVSDLFSTSVARLEENGEAGSMVRDGGMTDLQIVEKFRPPRRRSAAGITLLVAILFGSAAYYLYRRAGENIGQIAVVVAGVVTVIVFLTRVRRYSDEYYHRRRRWNSLYMCRKCGQLVAS